MKTQDPTENTIDMETAMQIQTEAHSQTHTSTDAQTHLPTDMEVKVRPVVNKRQKINPSKFWPYLISLFIGMALAVISNYAKAETLFEGYSKITSGGVSIGYVIQKYEYDKRKKRFISISYIKTNSLGGEVTESTKAITDKDFKPLSYQFTSISGGKKKSVKSIDAKIQKNKLTAKLIENGKTINIVKDLPEGTFFSSFLAYVILKSPNGLSADTSYNYTAIAEEDTDLMKGVAIVKDKESYKNIEAFKVFNEIKEPESKRQKFIVTLSNKGEMLLTKENDLSLSVELVTKPEDAIGKFGSSPSVLAALFGSVPTGQINSLATATAPASAPAAGSMATETTLTTTTTIQPGPNMKGYGVKPNQGMHLKGGK